MCNPVTHTGSKSPIKAVVIIPARYSSTRLPGKPLLPIAGKPLIVWVAERVSEASRISRAIVATDDERIFEAVTLAGEKFSGHTEFIAELCGVPEPRMLLVNERLRVVHVSTHVPLRTACRLDVQRVLRTIELGHEAVRQLGVERPRLAVCGLNPHAGENGLFGNEDAEYILPAVRTAQSQGLDCRGPFPADTVFLKAARGEYDLVVAMYHDQGHVPMKVLDFEHTVNVSLGLPIIRTSVDHGTAFDIAGKNQADPASMIAAMKLAARMALHRVVASNGS